MICPKCNSDNTRVEVQQEYKLKPKRSLLVRFLLIPFNIVMWMVFFIPKLILKLFRPTKYKLKIKTRKVFICNNCGYIK